MLAAGGTAGPVVPLLAVAKKIKEKYPHAEFLVVGSAAGPERLFATEAGLPFRSIPAGKLRRYFTWRNFAAPFLIFAGFVKALFLVAQFKPDAVFGAGGFSSVPVGLAAFVFRKKIIIHQQDVEPSLSNRILAPLASKVTVSFEDSLKDFDSGSGLFGFSRTQKVVWTGNPFREELLHAHNKEEISRLRAKFGFEEEIPVFLIFGGGTGAASLNQIIASALPALTKFAYVLHSTGKGKKIDFEHPRYNQQELILNMSEAYAIADLVVCRAGLSSITELSVLRKPAVIIPMPDSHQIYNALMLKALDAAVVLNQENLTGEELAQILRKLMYDLDLQRELRENIGKVMPHTATSKIATIISDLCQKR